jgi:sugar phosphate isomerase/epimerase
MQRRDFVGTLGGAALGMIFPLARGRAGGLNLVAEAAGARARGAARLDRIGLELYTLRDVMPRDPEGTLAAVRRMGYTDVELLWSFGNFGRTTAQVKAALDATGLRAPSAHMDAATILKDWERSLETAKLLGHEYLIVPSFTRETSRTLDDWRAWADRFNAAGATARRAGIWLAFHNEAEHMKPIDGQVPYDVFVERLDPSLVRLQLDTGNMLIGGGDPMRYLAKYPDRYWSFHLKDVVADRSRDTQLGTGIFDIGAFLAAVPALDSKPVYVEHESAADEMEAARNDFAYLRDLEFNPRAASR